MSWIGPDTYKNSGTRIRHNKDGRPHFTKLLKPANFLSDVTIVNKPTCNPNIIMYSYNINVYFTMQSATCSIQWLHDGCL